MLIWNQFLQEKKHHEKRKQQKNKKTHVKSVKSEIATWRLPRLPSTLTFEGILSDKCCCHDEIQADRLKGTDLKTASIGDYSNAW